MKMEKLKTKKQKKQKLQQEQEALLQEHDIETHASEPVPEEESVTDFVMPQYETLQLQSVASESLQTTAYTELPLVAPDEQPRTQTAHSKLISRKQVPIKEESQILEQEQTVKWVKQREEYVSTSVEGMELKAPNVEEMQVEQLPSVIAPLEATKATAKLSYDMRQHKSLMVEKTLVEESAKDDLQPTTREQHAQRHHIAPLQAPQQHQITVTETAEKLVEDKLLVVSGQIKQDLVPQAGLIIEEVVSEEATGKQVPPDKPRAMKVPHTMVVADSVLEVKEVALQETTKELITAAPQATDKSHTTFEEHKSYVAEQPFASETETEFVQALKPTAMKASKTVREVSNSLEVTENKPAETVTEVPAEKPEATHKAIDKLIVLESVQSTQPDLQSPLEEFKTLGQETEKLASMQLSEMSHLTVLSEFVEEVKPEKLKTPDTTTTRAHVQGEMPHLTTNEVFTALTAESVDDLNIPQIDAKHTAKFSITNGSLLTETHKDTAYESLADQEFKLPLWQQGKPNVDVASVVADISMVETQEKETVLVTMVPEASASVHPIFVENPNVVSVLSQQHVEREDTLKSFEQPQLRNAEQTTNLQDMKAPNVAVIQTESTITPLALEQTKFMQAHPTLDTNRVGLTFASELMETGDVLTDTCKPGEANITPIFNQATTSLGVYEVTISEAMGEKPTLETPISHQALVLQDEQSLKHLQTSEVVVLESSQETNAASQREKSNLKPNIVPQHAPETWTTTTMEATTKLDVMQQPELQHTQSDIDVIQPIESMIIHAHHKESILDVPQQPAGKQALSSTTNLLGVAQTFTQQPEEHPSAMAPQDLTHQHAHYTLEQCITSAVNIQTQGMHSLDTLYATPLDSTNQANVSMVENCAAVDIFEVNASQDETISDEFKTPLKSLAQSSITADLHKSPLVQKEAAYESSGKFLGTPSLETKGKLSDVEGHRHVSVSSTDIYESTKTLKASEMIKPQETQIELNVQSQLALIQREQILESSQDFVSHQVTKTSALWTTHESALKVPLKENVRGEESTAEMKAFKSPTTQAKLSRDTLTETLTSEALTLEDVSPNELAPILKVETLKETLQEPTNFAIVESSALIMEQEQTLGASKDSENTAQLSLAHKHNAALTFKPQLLEHTDILQDIPTDEHKANTITDILHSLMVSTKDKTQILDSVAKAAGQTQPQPSRAEIDHVLLRSVITENQQTAELEGILQPDKVLTKETTHVSAIPEFTLPLVEEVAIEETARKEAAVEKVTITATASLGAPQREVNVMEIHPFEDSNTFDDAVKTSSHAGVAVDENFKTIQIQTQQDSLQKESDMESFEPNKYIAKPFIEGMLRETLVSKPVAYEETPNLSLSQPSLVEAKSLTEDIVNQIHLQKIETTLHRETELPALSDNKTYAKPTLDDSDQVLQVSEVTTQESTDNFEFLTAQKHLAIANISDIPSKVQTMTTTTVLEKESDMISHSLRSERIGESSATQQRSEKTITEVVTCEGLAPLSEQPSVESQNASVSLTAPTANIKEIRDEPIFTKESSIKPLTAKQENASVKRESLTALLTEETIGVTTITETYELANRPEAYASIIEDVPKLKAQTVESLIAYENASNLETPSDSKQQPQTVVEDIEVKTPQTSTIQMYESVGEDSGDFKPFVEDTKSSIALPELKASVTEEIVADSGMGALDITKIMRHTSSIQSQEHQDKLTVSTVTPYETFQGLTSTDDTHQQAKIVISETTGQLVTPITTDEQPSSLTRDLEIEKPKPQMPLTEIQTQRYPTADTIVPISHPITEITESHDDVDASVKPKTYTVTHICEDKPTTDEKPVFITTFKSVQNEDGETVIETANKKITQEEGVLVEEVLSDTEPIREHDETSPHQIEIVEVNDITGEEPVVHKDYAINVIEEEPEEKEEEKEHVIHEIKTIEEYPEDKEESHPIEVIEEEEEETKEDVVEDSSKPKKSKKKVVRKKTEDHDAIIQRLLEQDIEKTQLEKYEKIEFDKPDKAKVELSSLEPIKIERKEQKPKKVVIVEAAEVPQMVKLKPSKRKEKPVEEQSVQLPKFKLKSRMTMVEYPPEPLKPVVTRIGAVKVSGELSRNIEEAEELLKFKPQKVKKIKKIKDDLEKVELEKYEKYVSSEEEPEEKDAYKKPEKPAKVEEKPEEVKLKIGKGKKKIPEEEKLETVTLKKTPEKPKLVEEVVEEKIVKKHKITVKEEEPKAEQPTYEMKPIEPLEFEDIEYPKEELEPIEFPDEPKKGKKEPKTKQKVKPKPKSEQEMNVTQIVPGKPKKEEEQPEETIKFRIPESEPTEEPIAEVKLKPFKKEEVETPVEAMVKVIKEEEPKEKSPSPAPRVEEKLVKRPKTKKEKLKKDDVVEEKPEESFEVSVQEVVVDEKKPVEEKVDKVKIKKKVPKEPKSEAVKVVEEVVEQPEVPEEIPVEYKITTTVIEPEEIYEDYKVRVVDTDEREETFEEVIEEKTVTRKKKPKPVVPEEYEFTIQEPKPEPIVEEEPREEIIVDIKKPAEPTVEEVAVIETVKQPAVKETVEEVSAKNKKKQKKPVPEKEAEIAVKVAEPVTKEPQAEVYDISVKETDAVVEKPVEKVEEEIEEKPESKTEKLAEVFPTYQIKTVESDAEKSLVVEEEELEQVKFSIKPKKPQEVPEEFEASVLLTEPKPVEEVEVETKIKPKKPKKPKKVEEESVQLEVKITETEKPVLEEIVEKETPQIDIVEEAPPEKVPEEYKIRISEEERVEEEEVPVVEFAVKPKKIEEKPAEELEAEFVVMETKPKEEVTEEARITTKKTKKKPKEVAADELKVTVVEDVPVEKPEIVKEVVEEVKPAPVREAPKEVPKEYEFKLKEFEIPKEEVVAKVEEIEEQPKEEVPEETYPEHKVKVTEETPQYVTEEVEEQEIKVIRKKKPKPKVVEEPEVEVVLAPKKPVEEVEEEAKIIKKTPKKPVIEEEQAELKVTVIEEIPQYVPEVIEVIEEEIKEVPIVQEIVEETPVSYEYSVTETEAQIEEEAPEEMFKLPKKKQPEPKEEPEEQVTIKAKKPKEEVTEEATIKKKTKKPKKIEEVSVEEKIVREEEVPQEVLVVEEEEEIQEQPQVIEEAPTEVHVTEEDKEIKHKEYKFTVTETERHEPEEVPQEEIKLKKKPKAVKPEVTEEPEVEISLKPKPEKQEVPEETAVVKKKSKPKPKEEAEAELKVQVVEEVAPEPEEIEEVSVVQKRPKKPIQEEVVEEEKVIIKKPKAKKEEEEEKVTEITLKPKKKPEIQEEEFAVDVKLPKQKQITEETSEETVQLKKKKKPVKPIEEAADELVIKQEVVEERPVEIEEEEIIEEAIVKRRKPKKAFVPQIEDHEEEEISLSIKKPHKIDAGVSEEATVLKKRPKKPLTHDEAAAELHIKREEEYDDVEDVEEFVVAQKPRPKPKQITEEEEQEVTIKKQRKKKQEFPEFTEVEHVTLRPKLPKTKEDIDQEFNIALDSYAEEEISMGSKVKLKKPIKKTYTEESDEASIKIMKDYDDGQAPIIEEIGDDTDIDEDIFDEEADAYHIEELPLDEVDIKRKPKVSPKPRYSIQNEEEEQFLIGIRRPKSDSVTYEEDSLTFKKKKKVVEQVFNEDGAALNITRVMDIQESGEENVMYSICNYVADSDEAINLVEGEKVYVIGRHSSEWWFIKKCTTEEEGWVPAQYLMEPEEYNQYVQKKLHEKIDKLPVFERPGPDEKPVAPKFIQKLQPIHTPEGYTVQFECKVEGVPRPQITWFRETAVLKQSQDFQMFYDDDNVATLIIREVFAEDCGRFTCVAKNSAGFTSTTTELIVETVVSEHASDRKSISRESSLADILEGIPPTFSRKPKAQYVDEDTDVILECRLVAVPEPEVVWTFNDEEIDSKVTKNVTIVTESDMHMYCTVVHIKKVKKSQEGTYEVVATNREGESRLPIILKVRTKDKEAPQVLEPLRNMVIREGDSVVLTTQIVGNPAPKITWYKNGKPLKGDIKSENDVHTLTLISPKREETGEYTVKAENPLGSVETAAFLTIEEPPSGNGEPPLFIERFEEQTVPKKSTIHLPAKVSGNPVPEVEWLFNNNPLYPNERIQQVYDGENIELIIKNANPEVDSGDYKCIASNPLGKTSHGARVIVEADKVTFTKKLKSKITIEEIQSLVLECETSHVVTTKWFFNGKELSGMDHRVVVEEGKVHKLVIKNTTLKDSGKYVCKVKNLETLSTVEVLKRKPEFVKPLEDYEVTEKDTAILDVEISADVPEVEWFKDGEKITPEKKNIDCIKDGKVHRLLIRNVTKHDEGEYSCKFEDQICKCEVKVIELPPEIVKPLEDVTVTEGETATFTVELDKEDALVKWFKDGKEVSPNERVQPSVDGKRHTITIKNAKPTDMGEYSVQAGDHTSKAKLTVEEPLVDFTLRLPDVTLATKNTDAEFTVELSNPDVELTWYKKGKPIKPNKKHEVFVEATVRRLVIHNADDDDAGEISCTAANVSTSTKLCVEEVKTAPIILSDKDQTVKVKENDDVTFTIKYTGVPQPEAEWSTSKKVLVKSKRLIPTIDEQSASLTIKKVVEEDEDTYTVKLANPVGEAEASLHLIIMRKPTAPGTPQPLEVMHDSITVYWKAPEDDGNAEIQEYILEYKDVKTEKWTEIRKIKDTTFTLSKLLIDTEYVFRSIAVNEVGPSPPSPLSPPIRLVAQVKKEKPSVQEPLQDITSEPNKEITLSCVFGGVPEPKVTWKKNGKTIETTTMTYENRVAKYIIKKTTSDTEAEYTCVATNEVGSVETSCRVRLQEKPLVEVEEKYLTQKLRTDKNLTIPATVKGYPQPKVTWYKETTVVKTTKRQIIETTETTTTLNIEKLTREDSGRYKVMAENESGTSSVECVIQVIDKPSRPQSLEIKDMKKDSIKLEWTPPIDDGGMDINKYILEKCELQNKVWMKVADFDKDIHSYAVQKLAVNSQYMFRVVAINPIGESEPTESEPVTITKKFDKPSPPRKPIEVSGMNDTSFTLSWQEPESDGGSKITEYIVEIKEFQETEYRLLGSTNGNVPNIRVTNVVKNKAYTFRIYAKNEAGTSEALETEDKIVVTRTITPPSPPRNLRCPDVTSRSVTLDWETPQYNGGSEITGYCIEKRSSTSTTWTKVITLNANIFQYTVDNLKEKAEYWFRVSAENVAGLGAPAVTDSVALKTHATVPSPPTAPLEARVIGANTHVFEWGMPESDGGAPLLGYHIAIRDMKKSMWIEVGRVPVGVQRFQIKDLQENHEYMIRIFAKNEVGLSEPLESDEPYHVCTSGQPSLDDEDRSAMSSCNTSSWLRNHHMVADIHSYARQQLLRHDEYFFRLWATLKPKRKSSK